MGNKLEKIAEQLIEFAATRREEALSKLAHKQYDDDPVIRNLLFMNDMSGVVRLLTAAQYIAADPDMPLELRARISVAIGDAHEFVANLPKAD